MKKWVKILEDLTFLQIFFLWVGTGILFAIAYYILNLFPQNSLFYFKTPLNNGFSDFLTVIYFSFVTLTSTGYGDIVPMGISKILAIIEIFLGLVVFGILISKIVSARQQILIEEMYELSLEEKVNKLRSGLYVSRVNISRIINKLSITRFLKNSDVIEIESNFEGLKGSISRVKRFLVSEDKKSITEVDELTLNILFNSLILSLSKVIETVNLLNTKKYDWKKNAMGGYVSECINSVKEIQRMYSNKQLKEDLKSLLKNIEELLKEIEYLNG